MLDLRFLTNPAGLNTCGSATVRPIFDTIA